MELWAQNKPVDRYQFKERKQEKLILPDTLIVMCFSTIPICTALQMKVLLCILSFTGLNINVAADAFDALTSTWSSSNHNSSSTTMALVQFTTADSPIKSVLLPDEILSPVVCK